MGLFSKKKKKDRQYQSEEAQDPVDPEFSKKKDPYLIIGNAPPRPAFAGKGLTPDTVYQFQRSDSGQAVPDRGPAEDAGDAPDTLMLNRAGVLNFVVPEARLTRGMPFNSAGVSSSRDVLAV